VTTRIFFELIAKYSPLHDSARMGFILANIGIITQSLGAFCLTCDHHVFFLHTPGIFELSRAIELLHEATQPRAPPSAKISPPKQTNRLVHPRWESNSRRRNRDAGPTTATPCRRAKRNSIVETHLRVQHAHIGIEGKGLSSPYIPLQCRHKSRALCPCFVTQSFWEIRLRIKLFGRPPKRRVQLASINVLL